MKEDNSLLIVVIVLLVLLFFSIVFGVFGFGGMGGMMNMMYGGFGVGMMLFGWLFGVLVFVALILFIVWLIKQINQSKKVKHG